MRSADQTIVMEAGRIVEQGTHDSLLAEGKTYAMLVRRQTGQNVDSAHSQDDISQSPALQVRHPGPLYCESTVDAGKAVQ